MSGSLGNSSIPGAAYDHLNMQIEEARLETLLLFGTLIFTSNAYVDEFRDGFVNDSRQTRFIHEASRLSAACLMFLEPTRGSLIVPL